MKKHRPVKFKKRWVVIGIAIFLLISYFCANPPTWIYYSIESNYITVTGTVDYINHNGGDIYFGCHSLSPGVSGDTFKLTGANRREAVNNGLFQKFTHGAQVEFVIPKLFYGNGYIYPVAAIRIDGV